MPFESIKQGQQGLAGATGATGAAGEHAITFADATARGAATPVFIGQLGLQIDTGLIYKGTALTAGSWTAVPASAVGAASTTHASTHGSGQSDAITITPTQAGLGNVLNSKQVVSISLTTSGMIHGSPVTFTVDSSGAATATLTLNTQNANLVFAGPSSGSAAAPTFRSLVAGDLPVIQMPGYKSGGRYSSQWASQGSGGSKTLTSGAVYLMPIFIDGPVTLSGMATRVKTGGTGNVKLALYTNVTGDPSAKIVETSTASTATSGEKVCSFSQNQTIPKGWYWMALICDSAIDVNIDNMILSWSLGITGESQAGAATLTRQATGSGTTLPDPIGTLTGVSTNTMPIMRIVVA